MYIYLINRLQQYILMVHTEALATTGAQKYCNLQI